MSDYLDRSRVYKGFHYSVLRPEMLEYLHKRTLEMFKQVIQIFQSNDICYMICGGTLLGAATGKFIPWDDDLDVCVFEKDYERAIDLLIDRLTDGAVLQCSKTDPHYYLGWIKVRDQYSHVYPDVPMFKENGVWIDIYKLVDVQERNIPYIIAKENIDYLERRLSVGGLSSEEYRQRLKNGQLQEKLESSQKEAEDLHERLRDTTDNLDTCIIWSASKVAVKKEWIFPLKKVRFEGLEVTTFGQYEEYLCQHYGKHYYELPPDELRRVGINRISWIRSLINDS